jgi:hypothetical protein
LSAANKTDRVSGETAGRLRVLLYDIESGPNLAWIWGKYEQNALGDFVKERQIISVAWKWLGEKEVHVLALPTLKSYRRDPENNKALIKCLHGLFRKADVTVGHNVNAFDDKMVNTEFAHHGFGPPPPHRTVDTLKIARRYFRFNSNKLGDLGAKFGFGKKVDTGGFKLWEGCLRGDRTSWELMKKYNKRDVVLLEKVYKFLRPWVDNHPDMNMKDLHVGCSVCRSTNLKPRGWSVAKGAVRKRRFQCGDCGKWLTGVKVGGEWKFR